MGDVLKDLTGLKFGHWTVLRRAENIGKQAAWLCRCDCGTERTVQGTSLKCGLSKSCGCKKSENHFKTHGESNSRLYRIWLQMKHRTSNPANHKYGDYGGRGIRVCTEWQTFEPFLKWAKENGYADNLQIDRLNVDGNYEPTNCRWVTRKVNMLNRRNTILITFKGETKPLLIWCEELGVPYCTVYSRIHEYGWTIEKALSTPVRKHKGYKK